MSKRAIFGFVISSLVLIYIQVCFATYFHNELRLPGFKIESRCSGYQEGVYISFRRVAAVSPQIENIDLPDKEIPFIGAISFDDRFTNTTYYFIVNVPGPKKGGYKRIIDCPSIKARALIKPKSFLLAPFAYPYRDKLTHKEDTRKIMKNLLADAHNQTS